MSIDEVLCHFEELEDPRSEINRLHPLVSVVVTSIMGILAGARGPTGIAEFALLKKDLLQSLLPFPHGIPRKDVFRRVLCALQPEAFQKCFVSWLQAMRTVAGVATGDSEEFLAIDGKTLRRSHDRKRGLGALHSVSVYASRLGLTLAQVATDEKSNEITAIPEVLKLVSLSGAIVTIDAMGTQKAIAEQIIDGGADYVLALKGNQETLHQAVIDYVDQQIETDFANVEARRHVTKENGHGRIETRHYIQMPAPKTLPGFANWKGLLTIGVAMLYCVRDGKETAETRYFISSLAMGVKRFGRAVRSHWGIENGCHWILDVTYREDESRVRNEHARENIAWLNRFTLSLLKQRDDKKSIAGRRDACGWSDEYLIETLTGAKV